MQKASSCLRGLLARVDELSCALVVAAGGGGSQNCYGVAVFTQERKIERSIIFSSWCRPLLLSVMHLFFLSVKMNTLKLLLVKDHARLACRHSGLLSLTREGQDESSLEMIQATRMQKASTCLRGLHVHPTAER